MDIHMHRVEKVRVRYYQPMNAHCITLFIRDDRASHSINLYGMEEGAALAMVKAMGDADTRVIDDGTTSLPDYLALKGVFDAIEGEKT